MMTQKAPSNGMCFLSRCFAALSVFLIISVVVPCYAQIEITDSHGKYRFESPPKRFVSLNWALTEQLLELGEVPLGIADLADFKRFSPVYNVDDTTVDLGPRLSPDLAKIKSLKPDVIFIGYSQRPLLRPLSNIATVIYFKNFGRRYDNAAKSDERFNELAKLFQKTAVASSRLSQRDMAMSELKSVVPDLMTGLLGSFSAGSGPELKPDSVTFLLLAPNSGNSDSIGLFGENSMPYAAFKQLGLKVVSPIKTDAFGVAQLSSLAISELLVAENVDEAPQPGTVCLVVFDEYAASASASKENASTALVKRLVAELGANRVHQQCYFELGYQQAFGGALSIKNLSESFVSALRDKTD